MSTPVDQADRRLAVRSIVRRYHRAERAVSWVVALSCAALAAVAILSLPFLVGVIIALSILVLVQLPLIRRQGEARLKTDADPREVRTEFMSTEPPILVFQWGITDVDDVTINGEVVNYEISYFFGLRTVTMEVERINRSASETDSDEGSTANKLKLVATINGIEWASYTVQIREREGHTVIDVTWTTNNRVDLRDLLQGIVARRYYPSALDALGYETRMHKGSWSV